MKRTKVTVVNKFTGEVQDFDLKTPEDVMQAWEICSETIKMYERAKDKMKALVPTFVDDRGVYESGGKMFRYSTIQRYKYDKTKLRNLIEDEDLFDTFTKVDNKLVDDWLKEGVENNDPIVREISGELRRSRIPDGNAYTRTALEKVGLDLPKGTIDESA